MRRVAGTKGSGAPGRRRRRKWWWRLTRTQMRMMRRKKLWVTMMKRRRGRRRHFPPPKRVPSAVRLAARLRSARLISPTQRSIIAVTRSVSITPRLPLFLLLAFASASASNAAGSMSCWNSMKLRGAAEDVWLDTMSDEERVQLNLMEKAPAATKTIAGRLTTVGGFQPSKEMLLISISRSNKIAKGFMDSPVLSVSMGEPPSCAM